MKRNAISIGAVEGLDFRWQNMLTSCAMTSKAAHARIDNFVWPDLLKMLDLSAWLQGHSRVGRGCRRQLKVLRFVKRHFSQLPFTVSLREWFWKERDSYCSVMPTRELLHDACSREQGMDMPKGNDIIWVVNTCTLLLVAKM
jgi:hypothetical protein